MTLEADEVKRKRLGLGLTQAALATRLGVARETVVRWEAGTQPISEPAARLLQTLRPERRSRKGK